MSKINNGSYILGNREITAHLDTFHATWNSLQVGNASLDGLRFQT
jgi:hypothetical protein